MFFSDKGTLNVIGEKDAVASVWNDILTELLQTDHSKGSHGSGSHGFKRGSKGYWIEMSKDPPGPRYWTVFKDGMGVRDTIKDIFNIAAVKMHEVDARTQNAVRNLVEKTFTTKLVGQGKDAVNLSHSGLCVTKVERIENMKLYKEYSDRRADFTRRLGGGFTYEKLESKPHAKHGEIMSAKHTDPLLQSDLYHEINEFYFFHGTDASNVKKITKNGLDPRLGSDAGMFGPGVYCAESSTKADQYAGDYTIFRFAF